MSTSTAPSNPQGRLHNRIAIVTGSSQGIGREICNQFFLEGAHLVCADLTPRSTSHSTDTDAGVETHDWIVQRGGRAIFVRVDVGEAGDWRSLIECAVREYGWVDIVVNNAGICTEAARPLPVYEADEDEFDAHMRVNTRGVFLGTKYCVQQFLRQEVRANGKEMRGWVVNLASMVANKGMAGLSGYTASKGAVAAMTKTFALDVAKMGIVVNCIAPGFSKTSMLDNALGGALSDTAKGVKAMIPRGIFGDPLDHAKAAVYLASDDAKWITGITLNVDGGLAAQ